MIPYKSRLDRCRYQYKCTKVGCPNGKEPSIVQAHILDQMDSDMWYTTDKERVESLNSLFVKGYVATARLGVLDEKKTEEVLLDIIIRGKYSGQPFVLWKRIKTQPKKARTIQQIQQDEDCGIGRACEIQKEASR